MVSNAINVCYLKSMCWNWYIISACCFLLKPNLAVEENVIDKRDNSRNVNFVVDIDGKFCNVYKKCSKDLFFLHKFLLILYYRSFSFTHHN